MKKPYYIVCPSDKVELNKGTISIGIDPDLPDMEHFYKCKETKINGQKMIATPISEMIRIFGLPSDIFLQDSMIDLLNDLKRKRGYYPIVAIDE